MLLLASGDVESKPGPVHIQTQLAEITKALTLLPILEQGQSTLFRELRNVQTSQTTMDGKLDSLSSKINAIEGD